VYITKGRRRRCAALSQPQNAQQTLAKGLVRFGCAGHASEADTVDLGEPEQATHFHFNNRRRTANADDERAQLLDGQVKLLGRLHDLAVAIAPKTTGGRTSNVSAVPVGGPRGVVRQGRTCRMTSSGGLADVVADERAILTVRGFCWGSAADAALPAAACAPDIAAGLDYGINGPRHGHSARIQHLPNKIACAVRATVAVSSTWMQM